MTVAATLPGRSHAPSRESGPIRFGIAGAGWPIDSYLRIASACQAQFQVTGVATDSASKLASLVEPLGVPLRGGVDELLADEPLFIVTSEPWDAHPHLLRSLVRAGVPVLSEAPPATTLEGLLQLCELVEDGGRIQVAEPYPLQPHHAARLAWSHSGRAGQVQQVQASVCHGYHGISLIRAFLGVGFEPVEVSARSVGPTSGRGGALRSCGRAESQTIAHLDFGGRFGVHDFTGEQYFSFVRGQRLLVRLERGEVIDQQAAWLTEEGTPMRVEFARHTAGIDGNLEGHHLKGIQAGESWVYRNPLAPARLSDEEIAVGDCLLRMADYARGGPDLYPLAEACQDRYLDILIREATDGGRPVLAEPQAWAA